MFITNKKFWEEIIAAFLWYSTDHIENQKKKWDMETDSKVIS
jgi:hypothetical protein